MRDSDQTRSHRLPSATWVLPIDNAAIGFLEAAASCLRGELTVCFEHAFADQKALDLYDANRTHRRFEIDRDTLEPETELHFCRLTLEFALQLTLLALERDASELFWHIKAFDEERLIFWIHDAYGESTVYLSGRVAESEVRHLSSECGSSASQIETSIDWELIRRVPDRDLDS
ncbi:hypothetical protein OVA24_16820 [Luteolibacter sp. SL250]|uniref:hypothetical protein n=1 Tax=Luteolibacter sp. SL250 TaxID=2995170 RepID=UPI00226E417C|nr:hypothetical protein [Luteolibacter sp. SL250]WAC18896.1 hypothetical protein OVA24_16820 [Luteolibacter sp. SL250]